MDRSLEGWRSPDEDHDQIRCGMPNTVRTPVQVNDRSRKGHGTLSNPEDKHKSVARLEMTDWVAPYKPLNTLYTVEKTREGLFASKRASYSYSTPSPSSKRMSKYTSDGDVFDLKRAESIDRKRLDKESGQVIVVDEEKMPSKLHGLLSTFRSPSVNIRRRKNTPARIMTVAKSRISFVPDSETGKSESDSEENVFESSKPKKEISSSGPSATADLVYMNKELLISALQVGELKINREDTHADAPMTFTVDRFVSTIRVGHDQKCYEIPNSSICAAYVQLNCLVCNDLLCTHVCVRACVVLLFERGIILS